ncbi:hypothetical protein F0344_34320 [Streptomyces finlayi]|uniref:Uncharacterized protein n=1 Tax=Streptomyces finlayi TaxID=67296 RepID=A0A7G7BD27_9ACTN|nr:hypothetical protein [Streptomyces finlayi]QNE73242.1 hypothetical protein F0344_00035 [Streptomyces finlayi]QNE78981.1 hypothetical protein F0344_34320 [Streptomyces finlayi]
MSGESRATSSSLMSWPSGADLDEDVLAEAAAEARAFGAGPAAAVDELVRGLLGQLADWQQSIGELGPRAHHGN